MSPAIFEQIKQAIDIREAAGRYGIEIRGNMASCPFHEDKRPSMSFKGSRWKCFSCNRGGTVIDLTAELHGITPGEAARKLNADFNLGLALDAPEAKETIERRRKDDELHKSFMAWEKRAWLTVTDYLHDLRADIEAYRPKSPEDTFDERYITALHEIDRVEYLADILLYGDFADKLDLYKRGRKEIAKYESRRNRTA